jgi:hypothetical protein
VPDRSHVYVRLAAIKFFLRHVFFSLTRTRRARQVSIPSRAFKTGAVDQD